MQAAVETESLSRRLGGRQVIHDLAMHVPRGAIYGFLGANGAGKTTTIRMLTGVLRPDGGTIRMFGEVIRPSMPRPIGALVESPALYDHLTGIENLDLTRRILALPRREVDRVLELVDLRAAGRRRTGGFSLGMRQRLGIARALLGRPRLLILDEPTNGLDPDGIRDMRALLRRLPDSGDMTLLVSSHLLGEVEAIATHVGLLHAGRLLAQAPLADLLAGPAATEVVTGDRARAAMILAEAGFRPSAHPEIEGALLVDAADPADVAALLHMRGERVTHLVRHRRRLEQVYQDLRAKAA